MGAQDYVVKRHMSPSSIIRRHRATSGRAELQSRVESGPHFAFNLDTSGGGAPASFVDRCNNSFNIGVGVGGNTSQPSVTIDVR